MKLYTSVTSVVSQGVFLGSVTQANFKTFLPLLVTNLIIHKHFIYTSNDINNYTLSQYISLNLTSPTHLDFKHIIKIIQKLMFHLFLCIFILYIDYCLCECSIERTIIESNNCEIFESNAKWNDYP